MKTTTEVRARFAAHGRTEWRTRLAALLVALIVSLPASAQTAARVKRTIHPGVAAPIVIETAPSAVCILRPEGSNDLAHSLRLYADQAGVIRFFARPRGPSTAGLELACTGSGRAVMTPIELHADTTSSVLAPEPVDLDPRSRSGASFVRPALQGDPMLPTAEELRSRGYPPRPDPKTAPTAYAIWLKAVTKPATFISPQTATRPDRVHGPVRLRPEAAAIQNATATSSNWSGFVTTENYSGAYYYVAGNWNVPWVAYEPDTFTYSSEWVGLDGWGSNDVVQEGTEQDAFAFSFFGQEWVFDDFYAWTEFYPDSEHPIANFQVSPTDQIYAWVEYYSGQGWYCIENISAQTYVCPPPEAPPSGTRFAGNSAEWIMERPTINGSLPDLAAYSFTTMCGYAYANYLTGGGTVDAAAYGNINVSMYNGPDLLSAAYPWLPAFTDSCIEFQWLNSH